MKEAGAGQGHGAAMIPSCHAAPGKLISYHPKTVRSLPAQGLLCLIEKWLVLCCQNYLLKNRTLM